MSKFPRAFILGLLLAAGALLLGAQQGNFPPLPPGLSSTAGTTPLVITGQNGTGNVLTLTPSAAGQGGGILRVSDGSGNVVFQVLGTAGAYQIQYGGTFNAHMTQGAANGDIAGRVTCVTNAVTKTFASAYTSAPTVILSDETTKGGASTTPGTASFVVSCTGASDVVDYYVIGNPN